MNYINDEVDFHILKNLQKDGRMSFTDLAKELDVSVSTIRNRYINLVNDEVINVYGRVSPEKIGLMAYARILVSVRPNNKIQAVIDQLIKLPEISFLASVSGDYDLEINLMCKDTNQMMETLNNLINKIEGIYHTQTNFYLKIHKFSTPDLDYIKENQ